MVRKKKTKTDDPIYIRFIQKTPVQKLVVYGDLGPMIVDNDEFYNEGDVQDVNPALAHEHISNGRAVLATHEESVQFIEQRMVDLNKGLTRMAKRIAKWIENDRVESLEYFFESADSREYFRDFIANEMEYDEILFLEIIFHERWGETAYETPEIEWKKRYGLLDD